MQNNNLRNKIVVVGTLLPLDAKNFGQRYEVYSWNGCIGAIVATEYKQPKCVLVKGEKIEQL